MLNHAKSTSVEVAALELNSGKGGAKYFVLPWKDNLPNRSRFSTDLSKYVKGYSWKDVAGMYHTHPQSRPPGAVDMAQGDKYNLPIYTIGANGTSYLYLGGIISPVDLRFSLGN
jgi:proteasome lid subunit RPN8/RPN11